MPPLRRPEAMPSGPRATARTAAASVTIENTISDCSATARGVAANFMPAVISGCAFSRERFQPVTACPAAISRGTISAPIAPRPTNPIFTMPASLLSDRDVAALALYGSRLLENRAQALRCYRQLRDRAGNADCIIDR